MVKREEKKNISITLLTIQNQMSQHFITSNNNKRKKMSYPSLHPNLHHYKPPFHRRYHRVCFPIITHINFTLTNTALLLPASRACTRQLSMTGNNGLNPTEKNRLIPLYWMYLHADINIHPCINVRLHVKHV